jgi:hypothetical protein
MQVPHQNPENASRCRDIVAFGQQDPAAKEPMVLRKVVAGGTALKAGHLGLGKVARQRTHSYKNDIEKPSTTDGPGDELRQGGTRASISKAMRIPCKP